MEPAADSNWDEVAEKVCMALCEAGYPTSTRQYQGHIVIDLNGIGFIPDEVLQRACKLAGYNQDGISKYSSDQDGDIIAKAGVVEFSDDPVFNPNLFDPSE